MTCRHLAFFSCELHAIMFFFGITCVRPFWSNIISRDFGASISAKGTHSPPTAPLFSLSPPDNVSVGNGKKQTNTALCYKERKNKIKDKKKKKRVLFLLREWVGLIVLKGILFTAGMGEVARRLCNEEKAF